MKTTAQNTHSPLLHRSSSPSRRPARSPLPQQPTPPPASRTLLFWIWPYQATTVLR